MVSLRKSMGVKRLRAASPRKNESGKQRQTGSRLKRTSGGRIMTASSRKSMSGRQLLRGRRAMRKRSGTAEDVPGTRKRRAAARRDKCFDVMT